MLSLQQYIIEKLVINKEFNKVECPNDNGYCLLLLISNLKSNGLSRRISLYDTKYTYNGNNNTITISHNNFSSLVFKINTCKYFYCQPNQYWHSLLLFDNEAIELLDELYKNNHKLMNVYKYLNLKEYKSVNLPFETTSNKYYNPERIKDMIDCIKQNDVEL